MKKTMKVHKRHSINKNSKNKKIKRGGGLTQSSMIPNFNPEFKGEVSFVNASGLAKDKNDIVTGDILIASNNKFIAELTVNMTEDGLEYTHYKGPALIQNYYKTWVAISKYDYERLSWGNRENDNNDYSDYGNTNINSKSELVIPEGYSPIVICNQYSGFKISNYDGKDYFDDRGNIELVKAVYNKGSDKFDSKEIEWDYYIINFIPSIMIKKGETIEPYLNVEDSKFAYYRINDYDGAEFLELFPDKYKIDKIRDLIKFDTRIDADDKLKKISKIIELDLKII